MLGALMRIAICLAIGTAFGWFANAEWEKKAHREKCKPVEAKRLVTKDDIRVVDWRGKK